MRYSINSTCWYSLGRMLRTASKGLLYNKCIMSTRTSVYFIINLMNEFQDIGLSYYHRLFKRISCSSIKNSAFSWILGFKYPWIGCLLTGFI
nr:hypothetical protein [Raphanus sativus]QGW48529.1 hypothetical protein [Raphanus sativus]